MNENKVQACDAVGEFDAANAAAASPNLAFTTGHVDAVGAADGRRFSAIESAVMAALLKDLAALLEKYQPWSSEPSARVRTEAPAPQPTAPRPVAYNRPPVHSGRLVRIAEVVQITGLQKSSIYAAMKAGTFPKSVKIGPRAVAWPLAHVQAWIDELEDAGRDR